MRNVIYSLIALVLTQSVFANSSHFYAGQLACVLKNSKADYIKINEIKGKIDKFKHCSLSCVLGVKCGVSITFSMGLAKEVFDLFNKNRNAEFKDIFANYLGVKQSIEISKSNRSIKYCAVGCFEKLEQYYPEYKKLQIEKKQIIIEKFMTKFSIK